MNKKEITDKKVIPLLQELIQNRCVNTGDPNSGQEIRSAKTLDRFFREYGLESTIIEAAPGRANLILRIPGNNPIAPSLAFMSHLDVVPADEQAWDTDPFGGELINGYVHGRGCVDMLNVTAAMAVAFAEFYKNNGQAEGDLLYIAAADEEASGRLGARWLVEEHWNLVKCDYMITELGGYFISSENGPVPTITLGEKGIAWLKLGFSGTTSHGSMPYKTDNALQKASKAALQIQSALTKVEFHPVYDKMLKSLVPSIIERLFLKMPLTSEWKLEEIYKSSPGKARFLHAGCRNTYSANMLHAGNKINIVPNYAELDIDARITPECGVEDVQTEIKNILDSIGKSATIEFTEFFPANISEENTPLMEATKQIIRQHYPNTGIAQLFISGVTDGRFWRQRGTTVYGFSLFDTDLTLDEYSSMLHGPNEKVSEKSLEKSFSYFLDLPEVFYSLESEDTYTYKEKENG